MTDLAMRASHRRAAAAGSASARRCRSATSARSTSSPSLFVLFALWVPDTFLTAGVWRSLLANSALTALVAIAVTIPLAAGTFNLAVGTEVGMAAILSAWLLERRHLGVVGRASCSRSPPAARSARSAAR